MIWRRRGSVLRSRARRSVCGSTLSPSASHHSATSTLRRLRAAIFDRLATKPAAATATPPPPNVCCMTILLLRSRVARFKRLDYVSMSFKSRGGAPSESGHSMMSKVLVGKAAPCRGRSASLRSKPLVLVEELGVSPLKPRLSLSRLTISRVFVQFVRASAIKNKSRNGCDIGNCQVDVKLARYSALLKLLKSDDRTAQYVR